MERVTDLIPEKNGEHNLHLVAEDGEVKITIDGRKLLDCTEGDAKLVFALLLKMYGMGYAKRMDKALGREGGKLRCQVSEQ